MKGFVCIALLLGVTAHAAAQETSVTPAKEPKGGHALPLRLVPSRPSRSAQTAGPTMVPEQFSPPQEAYASFPDTADSATPLKPSACQARLMKLAVFKPLPVLVGAGECGAVDAIMLESVVLPNRAKVAIMPPATLRCSMAEAVAAWLREDVAAAVLKLGAPLLEVDNFDSYECRGRNRVRGATLSEHGRANALDIRAFKLADGTVIGLTDVNVAKEWRQGLRASACARFATVLGPGSDGNHEEHIHVDLAERHGGYKTCEWDVREPVKEVATTEPQAEAPPTAALAAPVPLPRPRPVVASAADDAPLPPKKLHTQLR